MSFLEDTINWANYAESSEKLAFLKTLFQQYGCEELKFARAMITRKRKKEFICNDPTKPKRPWTGPRHFTGCRPPPVINPPCSAINPGGAVKIVLPEEEPEDQSKWWHMFEKKDCYAFDVEAAQRFRISLNLNDTNNPVMHIPMDRPMPNGTIVGAKEPQIPKAAFVSAVDYNLNSVFDEQIQHLPGTYRVDYYTKQFAGIASTRQLENGKPFKEVVDKFTEKFKYKLLISCAGGNDFRYMELASPNFINFDIQSFYQRPSFKIPGKMEHMSLRDIYFYHFEKDFRRGPHNAMADAKATMKILKDGYRHICKDIIDFSSAPNLKAQAKKGRYWCMNERKFLPKCNCKPCNNVAI